MKKLIAVSLSMLAAAAVQAANIVIKNDTASSPRIEVFQNSQRLVYLKRFKPGQTIVVPVSETGKKPYLVITQSRRQTSLFLPIKDHAVFFQFSWLSQMAR